METYLYTLTNKDRAILLSPVGWLNNNLIVAWGGDHLRLRGTTYHDTGHPKGTTCDDTRSPGGLATYCNISGPGGPSVGGRDH